MNALLKTVVPVLEPSERRGPIGTSVACARTMSKPRAHAGENAAVSKELIHDLRSPLQAIGLHAALLRREITRGDEAGLHHVETILREVKRLQSLMERGGNR